MFVTLCVSLYLSGRGHLFCNNCLRASFEGFETRAIANGAMTFLLLREVDERSDGRTHARRPLARPWDRPPAMTLAR